MLSNEKIINRMGMFIGNEIFVHDYKADRWYTYRETWEKAVFIADHLELEEADSLVAVMENSFELFSVYFSCMITNTTVIPLDPHKSCEEIDRIIAEHPSALVIKDNSVFMDMEFEKCNVPVDEKYLLEKIHNIDLNKDYMITYTSGSTGHAKGVVHSLRNLFLSAASFGITTGLNDGYTMAHVMPMTYMAGILNTIIMPFYFGCKIVLLPRFDVMSAVSFWKSVEKFNITAFWLSPTMLNILMTVDRKAEVRDYLEKENTLFYVGTAPLYENTRKKFEEKYKVKLLQSYGLSETLLISTETNEGVSNSASAGTILPDVNLMIYDDQEIGINVPWMFKRYTNENVSDYFREGNYISGDLGIIADDNKLLITGRKKDLIVKGGMNISPAQIEDCIAKTGKIKECAVTGMVINDEENIICWFVKEDGADFAFSDINSSIERNLGRHCKVDIFKQMEQLPKNLNGKLDKKILIEKFCE